MSLVKFYNFIAPFYPCIDFFLKPHKKYLIQKVNTYPKGKVLEIGAGSLHLNDYKNHHITVIDVSDKMLKKVEASHHQFDTFIMNGENTSFDNNSFDYIVMSHVLSVTKNPNQMILEAYRLLKPNGKLFILNHFTPTNLLYYTDYLFQSISSLLYFKSFFKINTLVALNLFKEDKRIALGNFNYYQLVILKKE